MLSTAEGSHFVGSLKIPLRIDSRQSVVTVPMTFKPRKWHVSLIQTVPYEITLPPRAVFSVYLLEHNHLLAEIHSPEFALNDLHLDKSIIPPGGGAKQSQQHEAPVPAPGHSQMMPSLSSGQYSYPSLSTTSPSPSLGAFPGLSQAQPQGMWPLPQPFWMQQGYPSVLPNVFVPQLSPPPQQQPPTFQSPHSHVYSTATDQEREEEEGEEDAQGS